MLVGICDRNFVSECDLTHKYTCDDCDLLKSIFHYFDAEIIITPHILAELSNLSIGGKIPVHKRPYYFQILTNKLRDFKEEQVPLQKLLGTKIEALVRFGFPDLGIIETAKKLDAVIITDDTRLAPHIHHLKIPCVQFHTVRANHRVNTPVAER